MSYILDALNKSEEERRGQEYVPSPQLAYANPISESNIGKIFMWVCAALIVMAIAGGGVFYFASKQPEVERPGSNSPPTLPTNNNVERSVVNVRNMNSHQVAVSNREVANHPQNKIKAKASPQAIASLYKQKSEGGEQVVSLPLSNVSPENGTPAIGKDTASEIIQGNRAPVLELSQEQLSEKVASYLRVLEQQENSLQEFNELPVVGENQQKKTVAHRNVPHIFDLPDNIQASIPTIEFSAHVYAFEEGAGFVILNGATRYSGDRLSADIVVEEIIQEGVVLSYKGTAFQLDSMRDWINN